jgi:hypothetical protein
MPINGCPTREFKMEMCLRQGDFVFLLTTEGFNIFMIKALDDRKFRGYNVGCDTVSHLQGWLLTGP